MARISRRKLIELLGAFVLAGGLPPEGSLANALINLSPGDAKQFDTKIFADGCIFIRRRPEAIDVSSVVSIDFWRSRVSDFEIDSPSDIGEVIVWDDLLFKDSLLPDIRNTIHHISKWYYTPFGLCTYGLHVSGYNTLAEAILQVAPLGQVRQNVRLAVVDVFSCGPTSLRWSSILPTIRDAYDFVVSVCFYFPELMEDFDEEPIQKIIPHCDVVIVATNELIGLDHSAGDDERNEPFNKLFHGLINFLASYDIFQNFCNGARSTVFCIGPTQSSGQPATLEMDRQALIVSREFSDGFSGCRYDGASPIVLDQIILWPLVYDAPDKDGAVAHSASQI